MYNNIYVRMIKLPCHIKGMTSVDENGDYNVYINEALSNELQYDTINHELSHIFNEDFASDKDIVEIENNAKNNEKTNYLTQHKGEITYA